MNWFQIGQTCLEQKNYVGAIKAFKKSFADSKNNPVFRIKSLIYIADSLKNILEYEIAEKVLQNALALARKENEPELIAIISEKIDRIYVSEEDSNKIGFIIKTFMKMIAGLAQNKNWF